ELSGGRMRLRIDATLHEVQQRVALTRLGILEIGHGADGFAGSREDHFYRIVEAAAREPVESGAVGPDAPDTRSLPFELAAVAGGDVEAVPAVGEVEQTVGSEDRTV